MWPWLGRAYTVFAGYGCGVLRGGVSFRALGEDVKEECDFLLRLGYSRWFG